MTHVFNKQPVLPRRRKLRHSMTKAEVYFWALVKGRAVDGVRFRRQFSVGPFILDFYVPQLKLAVEIDGAYHNLPDVQAYDKRRETYIREYGITFLRFTNAEVIDDPPGVIERLRLRLTELTRGVTPPPFQGGEERGGRTEAQRRTS